MIEKMNFLSITGPKADIDRVVNTYLCKYEIHLENALSELTTVESLTPFLDVNPYRDALNSINTIYEELKTPPSTSNRSPGIETALSTVKENPLPGGSAPEGTVRTGRKMFLSGRVTADHTSLPKY